MTGCVHPDSFIVEAKGEPNVKVAGVQPDLAR